MKNIEWKGNTLKISDLLYKEALGAFTQVQGRLAHGFSSLDELLRDVCDFFFKSSAIKRGRYKVIMYSNFSGYSGKNNFAKTVVRATFCVLNGRIVTFSFERFKIAGGQRVAQSIYTDGPESRKTHLARFTGIYQKFADTEDCPYHKEWEAFAKAMPDFAVRPID